MPEGSSCDDFLVKKILAAIALTLLAVALLTQRLFRLRTPLASLAQNSRQITLPTNSSSVSPPASEQSQLSSPNLASANQLPGGLRTSIESALPGYDLPAPSSGRHPYTEMCETNSSSPFLTGGDFTGHGRQEFALLLTDAEHLRFAIFSPDTAGQFHLVYLARPKTAEEWGKDSKESLIERPEQIDLCKIPKGKPWAPEAGDTFEDLKPSTDAVAIHTHPQQNYDAQSLILYKNGSFQQVFVEPFVQLR